MLAERKTEERSWLNIGYNGAERSGEQKKGLSGVERNVAERERIGELAKSDDPAIARRSGG